MHLGKFLGARWRASAIARLKRQGLDNNGSSGAEILKMAISRDLAGASIRNSSAISSGFRQLRKYDDGNLSRWDRVRTPPVSTSKRMNLFQK